jgi:soluble lytic murein transglycosylase
VRLIPTAFLLIILLSAHTFGEHGASPEAFLRQRDYTSAIDQLRGLETSNPESFAGHNYDYLLARLYEMSGRTAEAIPLYHKAAERSSPATAYALVHLSRIMRESGNLLLERIYLERLITTNGEFAASARLNLARNAGMAGNPSLAAQLLTASTRNAENRFIREDTVLLAESYLRAGDTARGRAILLQTLEATPNPNSPDDAALAAVRAIDAIDPGAEISDDEHLRRAKVYQFNREFPAARVHFQAVINRDGTSSNAAAAMLEIARGYSQLSEPVEALRWYERIQERFPETAAAKDALLLGSAAYGRVGKYKEALTRYQRFIEKFPADERLDRAYLNIVDIARDHADDREALKWAAKTREVFAGKYPETLAIFSEARVYMSRGEWQNALERLDTLAARTDQGLQNVPSAPSLAEVRFLRGFALEQLSRHAEAIDQYLAIPDGRNEYYGWRASERLKSMAKLDHATEHLSARLAENTSLLNSRSVDERRRAALAVVRLTESVDATTAAAEALRESFAKVMPPQKKEQAKHYDFLMLDGVEGETTAVKVALAESLWRKVPADYPVAMHDPGLYDLYPAPYAHLILQTARRYAVDPRLVLAIMRQESRFTSDAKSGSAARGLMQFITSAATKTAAGLGIENFRQSDLNSPQVAVLFGSYYLHQLGGQFPSQPSAVVASYNGGEDNVKRWVARSRSNEADRFVPEIQFAQTKDYVEKVMASYRVYSELYDENLRERSVTSH